MKTMQALHYCTLVRVEKDNSTLTHYYLDCDHGDDLSAALLRLRALAESGQSAWVEPFYGKIDKLDYRRYQQIEKPLEEEVRG